MTYKPLNEIGIFKFTQIINKEYAIITVECKLMNIRQIDIRKSPYFSHHSYS
jgi:hypothetical protein